MRNQQAWRRTALAVLLIGLDVLTFIISSNSAFYVHAKSWTSRRRLDAREKTRDLWNHGFNNYMQNAFPYDELMPLSCKGKGPDWGNPHNFAHNDVAGNFSVTLIDVLDTFIVLEDRKGFETAVRNVVNHVSFDVNTKPQVFETTIRVLGGLLSGHIFASKSDSQFYLPWYKGELLDLAYDLGRRLLPAFNTPTGLPYARLNLRHGVLFGESHDTCTAGAGSLILEFGTLSRLTGDDRFEKAAYKAFFALWNRRTDIGLVGNTINIFTGKWLSPEVTSIGAGIDSFFEYAFKWFVMSGEVEFLDVWHEAYASIMRYARGKDGFWFRPVSIYSGAPVFNTIDSLSAFWPGLQVLAGDIENAIKSHLIFWNLWKRHSGLPEVWDINYMQAVATQYPLRPEFVESTYYLYRATQDPFYLDVGEQILYDLIFRSKVPCGLTGISDLKINKRDDRMESFVLSETLKYLYLLFDDSNPLHKDDSNFVFTTEGHILTLETKHLKPLSPARRKRRRVEKLQCPVYHPLRLGRGWEDNEDIGLTTGINHRSDFDYARTLVGTISSESDSLWYSPYGVCDIPSADLYSYDFILSSNGAIVPEDLSPSLQKLYEVEDGFVLLNVTGIRAHIVSRLDGKGYDIVKLAQYPVRSGQTVYFNDTELRLASVHEGPIEETHDETGFPIGRSRDVPLRFLLKSGDGLVQPGEIDYEFRTISFSSVFGGDAFFQEHFIADINGGLGTKLVRYSTNGLGCLPYDEEGSALLAGAVVVVQRGTCTFLEKLVHAYRANARGVIVISDVETPINPTAERYEIDQFADVAFGDPVLLVVTKSAGDIISRVMDTADAQGLAEVYVALDLEVRAKRADTSEPVGNSERIDEQRTSGSSAREIQSKMLYLNGHPLLNTVLLI